MKYQEYANEVDASFDALVRRLDELEEGKTSSGYVVNVIGAWVRYKAALSHQDEVED